MVSQSLQKYFKTIICQKIWYDKRRPHLSSLIVSDQISRSEALKKINEPLYDENELEVDLDFLCKKLEIEKLILTK